MSYRDLAELQPSPFATLAHGGGGTAYVLARFGERRRAAAWVSECLADRRRAAFEAVGFPLDRRSYLYGRPGLHGLRATLVRSARATSIASFVRDVGRATGPWELAYGTAGHLTAARLLLAAGDDPPLRELARRLRARLVARVRDRTRTPWHADDAAGFAHHWPGALHAVLAWAGFAGEEVPGWLVDSLRALVAVWRPEATQVAALPASWCNGAAGTVLLWCKAYEVMGDERFLRAARRAAHRAATAPRAGSDLCCGDTGAAYALLELDRLDGALRGRRGQRWRQQARALATRALADAAFEWPNGLFRGHPGLACLAMDLSSRAAPARFPAIEAIADER